MIGSLDTLGLRVENMSPAAFSNNVSTGSTLTVTFNSELNTDTIIESVLVLEDKSKSYVRGNKLNIKDYKVVNTTVTYKDKQVIISPSQLEESCRYIIYISKNKLQDILNNMMLTDYVSYFDTADSSDIECSVIEPLNNSILSKLDKIILSDSISYRYVIQISKQQDFETTVYDEIVDGTKIYRDFHLEDGLYYVRAKGENSTEFGPWNVFSIKSYKNTSVADQDLDEDYVYEEVTDEELKILSSYPYIDEPLVDVKSNAVYMKLNKFIEEDEIDFYESNFYGKFIDSDDTYYLDNLNDNQKEDTNIDGHFTYVYDEAKGETYIFFVPNAL
jgi:hypothetical protein